MGRVLSSDPSSVKVRNSIKQRLRQLPPGLREELLQTSEAIAALGAATCAQLRREITRLRRKVKGQACSTAWYQDWDRRGQAYPPAGMKLSRAEVRDGETGKPSRRWTPAIAVDVEDELDTMDATAAMTYNYPASPSAVACIQIKEREAKPVNRILFERGRDPFDRGL